MSETETDPKNLPPDYDAPGQVDFPDPAFDEEEEGDEDDMETPDEGEPDG